MTGLIVSSPVFGGSSDFFARFDGSLVDWHRTRRRIGGDYDGKLVIVGDIETLNSLWRTLPGYDIREEEGENPWRGFIWATTLHHRGVSRMLSYETLHNAVRAKYKNKIANGGFESAGATPPAFADWSQTIGGTDTIVAETDLNYVNDGLQAAKLTYGNNGNTYLYQVVPVSGSTEYRLRFRTRGDGTVDGRYRVVDVVTATNLIPTTNTGKTGLAYGVVEASFVTLSYSQEARIYLYAPGAVGSAWFDAVSCQRLIDGNEVFSYTDWELNAQSVSRYGRKELTIDADKTNPANAEILAQNSLAANAWLKPSKPHINDGGQQKTYLEINCVGYWATAFFKYVDFDNSSQAREGDETVSSLITSVLGDDCDWLTAVSIQADSSKYQSDRGMNITAGALIERFASDDYRLKVDGNRGVIYEAIDTSPSLYRYEAAYTETPGGTIPVDAHKVEAGIVVRDMDWPVSSGHYADNLENETDYIGNEWEVSPDGELKFRG